MLGSSSLSMDDLISYGFLPEFVGRFPVEAPPLLPRPCCPAPAAPPLLPLLQREAVQPLTPARLRRTRCTPS